MVRLQDLQELTPVLQAQVLEPGQRYLVTLPAGATPSAFENVGRMLDAAGLEDSILIDDSIKFQHLIFTPEPQKPWYARLFGG